MRTTLATLLLVAGAAAPALALAEDVAGPEARMSWQMGFGAPSGRLESHYALALGYRDAAGPMLKAAEFNLGPDLALARLAGMPVVWHDYRLNQRDDPFAYSSSPLTWVWVAITGGALVAHAISQSDDEAAPAPATGGSGN